MSERFAQREEMFDGEPTESWREWPGSSPEPEKCGVWNTVAILLGATGIGIVIGLIGWKVFG